MCHVEGRRAEALKGRDVGTQASRRFTRWGTEHGEHVEARAMARRIETGEEEVLGAKPRTRGRLIACYGSSMLERTLLEAAAERE